MTEQPCAWVTAYLSLGANLGDRLAQLRAALQALPGPQLRIEAVSPVYETAHVGDGLDEGLPHPDYLNCVARIETALSPVALLQRAHEVEAEGSRVRDVRWGPRTIDIDVLLYGNFRIDTPDLTIPHPRMAERAFVVLPLRDLAPELQVSDGMTASQLASTPGLAAQRIALYAPELL